MLQAVHVAVIRLGVRLPVCLPLLIEFLFSSHRVLSKLRHRRRLEFRRGQNIQFSGDSSAPAVHVFASFMAHGQCRW
ncbi:hypothetical protein BKA59DRAFT_188695 [Fusarium tricinctum]|uniref:Uncharacterized protein n=1 Tax=Fusarium tricinctum TaxID=61284 RepID=A0A8K0WCJ0_9HYPO|nr:hypothetical protein BKA59DRAFT_188695 [Fusarium tricinctum]